MIKPIEIIFAAAPVTAGFMLGQINEIAAAVFGVFGCIFLCLGIAIRVRKLQRGEQSPQ
jgi:hypothetical protein